MTSGAGGRDWVTWTDCGTGFMAGRRGRELGVSENSGTRLNWRECQVIRAAIRSVFCHIEGQSFGREEKVVFCLPGILNWDCVVGMFERFSIIGCLGYYLIKIV